MGTPVPPREEASGGLTSIHARIHCAATPDTADLEVNDELERIDIDSFISALAEVASSVARREQQRIDHESGSLHPSQ